VNRRYALQPQHLVADIAEHGLREPIWLHEGQIIDGRNRYRACIEARREPEFRAYEGEHLVPFVVSLNLHRRHLNESQRAMVAGKLANLPDGVRVDRSANLPTSPMSQPEAAELLNVSERSCLNMRWRSWLKWLWIEARTEANFCRGHRQLITLRSCGCWLVVTCSPETGPGWLSGVSLQPETGVPPTIANKLALD